MATKGAVGPDNYTEATINDLSEVDMDLLSRVWPAAFLAVSHLLIAVDDGDAPEDDDRLDLNLFDLTYASMETGA